MRALPIEGPVARPALSSSGRYSRQPIGRGTRAIVRTDPARVASRRIANGPAPRRTPNHSALYVTAAFAVVISLTALGIGASVDSPRSLMARADYDQARRVIEAEARAALAQCRALEARDKDVCKAQARGQERVSKADLDARYRGTVAAESDTRLARAKATYEVARASCANRAGEERSACLKAARAEKVKALADARPSAT